MRERGLVLDTRGAVALVQFEKGKHCQGCNACQAFGQGSAILEARNKIHAQPGEFVEVEIPPRHVITSSFVVFIVPALLMIVGYLMAGNWFGASQDGCVLGAFLGLFGGFGAVMLYDRLVGARNNSPATIVQRVTPSDSKSDTQVIGL